MEKITCQICGEQVHAISIHLKKTDDSAHDMTLAEYKEQYPDAPTMSATALELAKKKMAGQVKESTESKNEEALQEGKVALYKAYSLRNSKKTQRPNGDPIMLTKDTREKDVRVPEFDRNIFSNLEDVKTVAMGFERRIPTFVYGDPGVGKTTEFRQLCAATNRRLIRVQHTANTEESHIMGRLVAKAKTDDNGHTVSVTEFELGPLPIAMIEGCTYLADEYDRCHPAVLSVYQAVLEGQPLVIPDAPPELQRIEPHPMFHFVATGNTNGSGDGGDRFQATFQQDAATIERFGIVLKKDYLPTDQEEQLLIDTIGLDQKDAKTVVKVASHIRQRYGTDFSLTIGNRVLIMIATISLMKGSFVKGFELAYANRLPEDERLAVMKYVETELAG